MKATTIIIIFLLFVGFTKAQRFDDNPVPFSTNEDELTIWNGSEYLPFFVKGMNLGVSVPGTFPGELAATRAQYGRWFEQIKNAGFNTIRLYTLHYPRFYEVLDSFNIVHQKNPLFFMQGVWLNEEMDGYANDLYFIADTFKVEISENIDCVHGNKLIAPRFGKAYGNYTADVSKWNMAYIIGREVYPSEILTTNASNPNINSFNGNHFAIEDATASEVWFTSSLDYLVDYEETNYSTQRPVSASSWPTLDPIVHSEEPNIGEDTAFVDLSKIVLTNAPAGFFISYHAYPYYPDFIGAQSSYQEYHDNYGPNSYLGYLIDLKSHYQNFPLLIAEFGVPSSWGVAHYTSSGMNHGGFDEESQGETNIRLLHTMRDANIGGGIQFAWIDEWFKRTWITDPIDYNPESRILWHNVTAAEQNFGLVSFTKNTEFENLASFGDDSNISRIDAGSNYNFLEIEIGLKNPLDIPDEIWVALDTYSENLGELILPTGDTLPHRSEFMLKITNHSATLYVTEAYDLYGIWHNISEPNQMFKSIATDGAPWKIVRWKNNSGHSSVQYIGELQLSYGFLPQSSKDAVTIFDDMIKIKMPWSLINVVDPSKMSVFHDNINTSTPEDTISDGIMISVLYKDEFYSNPSRFTWANWNNANDINVDETFKKSYWVMQDRLHDFNTKAVCFTDSLFLHGPDYPVEVSFEQGLLQNDFDLDGDLLIALLTRIPQNGEVNLNNDGSFSYMPNIGFNGFDTFEYCIFDGYSLSKSNTVTLSVSGNISGIDDFITSNNISIEVYPNPASDFVKVKSSKNKISEIIIFDSLGHKLNTIQINSSRAKLDISNYPPGYYTIIVVINGRFITRKIIIV